MKQKIYFELLWILITIVFASMIVLPIYQNVGASFNYYQENIIFIIVAFTFGRYIFFLKHHWMYKIKMAKVVLIFIPIPVFLYLMDSVYDFQRFLDEDGIMSVMSHLPGESQMNWSKYIKNELFLFWSAAVISNAIIPFRMLYSLSKDFRFKSR